jgi:hypothetical protein
MCGFRLFIPSLTRASASGRMFVPFHGAYFESERDRTCCYCSSFTPWDVCSTRRSDFHFAITFLASWCLFHSCRGLTSACSFFVSRMGSVSRVSGSYTLCSPSSLACKGEMEIFRPMRGFWLPLGAFLWTIGTSVQPDAPFYLPLAFLYVLVTLKCIK